VFDRTGALGARHLERSVVALACSAMLVLAACGDGDGDGSGDGATTSAAPTTTAAAGDATTTTGAAGAPTVATATTGLGTILTDAEGFTLYVFAQDPPDESACGAGCVDVWPPATLDGELTVGEGLDAAMFSTITRDDGATQLTVNEQPLYRYVPDTAPGDTNGQGVGGVWHVVGTDGEPIS
jgi:predicted lipoprotein with Yx(FWY)xxD motif